MEIEAGQILFIKKAKIDLKRGGTEVSFRGPVACMAMGALDPSVKTLDQGDIDRKLASLGLFYADDVAEVVGDELYKKLVKHLEEKYK